MKVTSKMTNSILFAAMLACLIVSGSGSAFAGTPHVLRTLQDKTFTGECCTSFDQTIDITEPATLVPVIVVWSTDYKVNVEDFYFVGLSVNGGACTFWGPRGLADNPGPGSSWSSAASFQWLILPSDGVLIKGTNKIEVCGGGQSSASDSISLGNGTLTVQVGAN